MCSSSGKSRPFRDAQYRLGCCSPGAFLVPPKAGEAPPWKGSRMTPPPLMPQPLETSLFSLLLKRLEREAGSSLCSSSLWGGAVHIPES